MSGSINMDTLIGVTPSVLPSGGDALDLVGMALTNNTRVPMGSVVSLAAADVSGYFGPAAAETAAAVIYFRGFNNSSKKPGLLRFAQYPVTPVSAYTRGATLYGMTLLQLQALSGSFNVTVDGVAKTAANVSFAAATSWTNAATILGTAINANVTYDPIAKAFVVTSGTTGASVSTIAYATGTLATSLNMTQPKGAVVSPGADVATPAALMESLVAITRDWATFTTLWEPSLADKTSFAMWNDGKSNRYLYVPWDTDAQAIVPGSTTAFGAVLQAAGYNGTAPVYQDMGVSLFVMGFVASLDFNETNGRATAAYKGNDQLTPIVNSGAMAQPLKDKGYNYYGTYSTANQRFSFLYPGCVSGSFKWIDSYINQIWMNSQFQLALTVLEMSVKSIPYNQDGYTLMEAALLDPIGDALNFGAIRANVPLSESQAQQVNQNAGVVIAPILSTRGWYLQILPAPASVRGNRGSPSCKFWYMDGGSVQSIALNSVEVQ